MPSYRGQDGNQLELRVRNRNGRRGIEEGFREEWQKGRNEAILSVF